MNERSRSQFSFGFRDSAVRVGKDAVSSSNSASFSNAAGFYPAEPVDKSSGALRVVSSQPGTRLRPASILLLTSSC